MSLDLELFRLTRKKSADPVARSSGQACLARQSATLIQHYNLLQFYYILQYWGTFYFMLLIRRSDPFWYVHCALIYAMPYFHISGVTMPGPTLHST